MHACNNHACGEKNTVLDDIVNEAWADVDAQYRAQHTLAPTDDVAMDDNDNDNDHVEDGAVILYEGRFGRSRKEFAVAAYTMDALGLPIDKRDDLLMAIQLGDERGLIDFSLPLTDTDGRVLTILDVEWDSRRRLTQETTRRRVGTRQFRE
jgi:hypothetical protein